MPLVMQKMNKCFRLIALLAFGGWALGIAGAATAQSPHEEAGAVEPLGDVRGILAEMADLEQQLEEVRRAQGEEETRIEQTGRSLESIQTRLREREGLHEETKDFLEQLDQRRQGKSQSIAKEIDQSRRTIDVSGEAVRLSTAWLYGLGKSPRTRQVNLVTLARMLQTHHTRAQVESRRVLRLETERADLGESRARADLAARQHSIFTEYGLEQLHTRHKELADRLVAFQSESEAQGEQVRSLSEKREQLQALMTRLVEAESRAAAESPRLTPTPAAVKTPDVSEATPAVIETPMVSQTASAESRPADSISTEGERTLFWRAEPIGIRALASGQVAFAGPFAGYRHLLIISHCSGFRTLYGNMVSATVREGDSVVVGQQIGVYQAGAGQRAEPFWFEVRKGKDVVTTDEWAGLPTQWRRKLFMRLENE